jgi:hypothetical protein
MREALSRFKIHRTHYTELRGHNAPDENSDHFRTPGSRGINSKRIIATGYGRKLSAESFQELNVISKPTAKYQCYEYLELDLPVVPAFMVGNEIEVQGANVSQEKVEAVVSRMLGYRNPRRKE